MYTILNKTLLIIDQYNKSAQVVNSHLVCDPTNQQPGFDLIRQQWSVLNHFAWNRNTVVPAEGNGDLQTLIYVLAARLGWCPTLSNPVVWQSWIVAYPSCSLQMKMLFPGWPIMVRDTHMRRRRRSITRSSDKLVVYCVFCVSKFELIWSTTDYHWCADLLCWCEFCVKWSGDI